MTTLSQPHIRRDEKVRKVDVTGVITTVAGNGAQGFSGDGGPAVNARFNDPMGVALDGAGNLYIADYHNHRVRKVRVDGTILTVAGTGEAGYGGDAGLATSAQLHNPGGIAVDASGNLYIADELNQRIRKVDVNGTISTVAGNGIPGVAGDGGPAVEAQFHNPARVAVDGVGNLYVADWINSRIRKIDAGGVITTVAGNGSPGYAGDGGPATAASLNGPTGIVLDGSGNLYITDGWNECVRKVDTLGIITTAAGSGTRGFDGDGGPAVQARLFYPTDVALDPSGRLFIADNANHCVRKVVMGTNPTGYENPGESSFFDEGGLGYIFSASGKHLRTVDLATGVVARTFAYNPDGALASISDPFGNRVTIQRDANGTPISITSPFGVTTGLAVDPATNRLTDITFADTGVTHFDYSPEGLILAKVEPQLNRFEHVFDANGRITDATDEEGGHWQFSRTELETGEIRSEVLTAEGEVHSYLDRTGSTGAYTSTITDETGSQTLFSKSEDSLATEQSNPCGMANSHKYGVDPLYGFKMVKEARERAPSALEKVVLTDRTYEDTDSDGVRDKITDTITLNGKTATVITDTIQAKKTAVSPEERTATTFYDPNSLAPTSLGIPGLFTTTYGYDARGRLTSLLTGTRETTFTYDAQGNLESITDPEDHATTYSYDPVGRMTAIHRPGGGSVGFAYDKNGSMTVLTNPAEIDHGFGYSKVNLNGSYDAPLSGTTTYLYDRDRRLIQVSFPSGKAIRNIYADGKLELIQTPEGDVDLSYACGTQVHSVAKIGEGISYGYDGSLLTSETLTGTVSHTLAYGYNSDFNLTSFTYAGETVNFTYDDDGLLTGAGSYTISRNTSNGLPESVTGENLSLGRAFNGFGEMESESVTVSGQTVASFSLARDNNGRILSRTETVAGTASNFVYTYDPMGRLLTVTKDGSLVEEYRYETDGTRSHEVNTQRGITDRSFTYSDEDHLLTSGSTTYQYDLDGYLQTKTAGTDQTTYVYSSQGELLSVTLPDTRLIEYVHDPLGRRIAKKINGTITEKYLWQGQTRLLAVFDANDTLLMKFLYADARMPVAMLKQGTTYYLACDQVGFLRLVADPSGSIVKRIDYDSFGNILTDSDPSFTLPFAFSGGFHDADTGLVRFGYRDYDPDTGRWTAKDPILFKGGDTDLYGYVQNDPVNQVDPRGLLTVAIGIAGTGGGGAAGTYSKALVVDGHGNIGMISTLGGGGMGGITASGGGMIQIKNADNIYQLTGFSVQTGGSFGEVFSGGGEWVIGDGYTGVDINFGYGIGLTPGELHSILGHSTINGSFNIFRFLWSLEQAIKSRLSTGSCP